MHAIQEKQYKKLLTHVLAFFFSMPFGLVLLTICFGPSINDHASIAFLKKWTPLLLAVEFPLSYLAYFVILRQTLFLRFLLMTIAVAFLMLTFSIVVAANIHRDFFTATFQYLLCLPALFLFHLWVNPQSDITKSALRAVSRAGYILVFLYSEWIIFMGYAIVTRAEPRPIEAMFYNVYNLLLVLMLFLLSHQIKQKTLLTVHLGLSKLMIDNRDVLSIFGPKKTLLLYSFASAKERTLRCSDIQIIQKTENAPESQICSDCKKNETKATLCTKYRTTYNTILEMKKLLEFLEIGTITTSLNKRNILTEGWKLILFENVRIQLLNR